MNNLYRAKIMFKDGTYEWFWDSTNDFGIFEYDLDVERGDEVDFLNNLKDEILEQYQDNRVSAIKFYPLTYEEPLTLTL